MPSSPAPCRLPAPTADGRQPRLRRRAAGVQPVPRVTAQFTPAAISREKDLSAAPAAGTTSLAEDPVNLPDWFRGPRTWLHADLLA